MDFSGLKDALKAKTAAGESITAIGKSTAAAGESITAIGESTAATGEATAADGALQECINRLQIRYNKQDVSGKWCNSNGIVAYANTDKLLQVMTRL